MGHTCKGTGLGKTLNFFFKMIVKYFFKNAPYLIPFNYTQATVDFIRFNY